MGDSAIQYHKLLATVIQEAHIHLERIDSALHDLSQQFPFPITADDYQKIQDNKQQLALADQAIYRFSKAQDVIGAKLFKTFLLAQGEDIDRPFLDILNLLEKIHILSVNDWFELRDLRNEISHDYDADQAMNILNAIEHYRLTLSNIVQAIQNTL